MNTRYQEQVKSKLVLPEKFPNIINIYEPVSSILDQIVLPYEQILSYYESYF